MVMQPRLDFETVKSMYYGQSMSTLMIGQALGFTAVSVGRLLKRHGCELRDCHESLRLWYRVGGHKPPNFNHDVPNDVIVDMYVHQKKSLHAVADSLSISYQTVQRRLIASGNHTRSVQEGISLRGMKRGKDSAHWKGGKTLSRGYVYILCPNHPHVNTRGYVAEHILAWEKANNADLPKGWHVHHLNALKTDNRPENLVALRPKDHAGEHGALKKASHERIRYLEAEVERLRLLQVREL